MKQVLYHWVEMRTIEVPDECPTTSYNAMIDWLQNNGHDFNGDEQQHDLVVKADSRDWEIVDVS